MTFGTPNPKQHDFLYCGGRYIQNIDTYCIKISYDHYKKALPESTGIDMKNRSDDEELNKEDLKKNRSAIGKLSWFILV